MENAIPLSLYNIYSLILTETMEKQFTPEITLFFLATLVAQRSKYLLKVHGPKIVNLAIEADYKGPFTLDNCLTTPRQSEIFLVLPHGEF